MQKCQYIRECDLPPLASAAEIAHIRAACDQRAKAGLGYSAKQSIALWRVPEAQLRGAIIRHINAGRRMFHKFKDDFSGTLIRRTSRQTSLYQPVPTFTSKSPSWTKA
jgi:hypothetical protein